MKAVANSILAALLISTFLLTFTNFILFFPWYLTLVFETFNLSTQAAGINYIKPEMVRYVEDDLKSRPLFKDPAVKNTIFVKLEGNRIKASDDESTIKANYCKQRGASFKVSLTASFPFIVKAFGSTFTRTHEVTFELPTTGIRYYKELP